MCEAPRGENRTSGEILYLGPAFLAPVALVQTHADRLGGQPLIATGAALLGGAIRVTTEETASLSRNAWAAAKLLRERRIQKSIPWPRCSAKNQEAG